MGSVDLMEIDSRFLSQLSFLCEAAKLKQVERKTQLIGGGRLENSAEHSWHVILTAMLLAEHSAESIDLFKVVKMLAIHDLGEILSGDTCHYFKDETDSEHGEAQSVREIFAILPQDQRQELGTLWEEFEAQETAEAKFAAALDRMWPIIQNANNNGGSWSQLGITAKMAVEKNEHVDTGSPLLWTYLRELIEQSEQKGLFAGTTL